MVSGQCVSSQFKENNFPVLFSKQGQRRPPRALHYKINTHTNTPAVGGPIKCGVHRFSGLFRYKMYACALRRNRVLSSLAALKWFLIAAAVLPLTLTRSRPDKNAQKAASTLKCGDPFFKKKKKNLIEKRDQIFLLLFCWVFKIRLSWRQQSCSIISSYISYPWVISSF